VNRIKNNIFSNILSILVLFTFLSSNLTIANGTELSYQNISPPWIMAASPSPGREAFQRQVLSHWTYNYVFLTISKFLLEKRGETEELKSFLKEALSGREKEIRDMYVFIDEVTVARDKVRILFKKDGKRGVAEIWRAPENEDQKFVIMIRPDEVNASGIGEGQDKDRRFDISRMSVASLSLEGFIPELKEKEAIEANTRGGLGAYDGDKQEGLARIGAAGMGFQPGYALGSIDGEITKVDYKKLAEEGIIEAVDTGDEALEVWAGAEDNLVTGEHYDNNVKTRVEVYRVNRGGTWKYIFVSDVFDRLYADGFLHRFMQQVVFGKAVYVFMKKHNVRPDIIHLNETPPVVAAMLIRADENFNDTAIVYTNHTLVPAGFHDQRFSRRRIGLDVGRMEYLMGLPENKVDNFRKFFMRNGNTVDFCHAAMKIADVINAVSDEHAERTVKLFRDEYGVDLEGKVIGVLNGSGEEWVSAGLKDLMEKGSLPTADEIWENHEANKGEVYEEIEERTGIKLDPKKLTMWAVRRIVEYKSQYPVLRFIVYILCSSKEESFTRERLMELWRRDMPALSGKYAGKVYNKDIERTAEHILDRLFAGRDTINGLDMQLVIGGPEYEKDWGRQFRKWMRDIPEINGNVVFLENHEPSLLYTQAIASDICINMPRPFEEACGTSDQRSARNGGVNIALMGAGPVEWMREYNEKTGNGSGFFIGPYLRETGDGAEADLKSFYNNAPVDVLLKAEKASGLFRRRSKLKWKGLMLNAFMDSTFGLDKKAVTAYAMEERYASLVYRNAIAERRGIDSVRKKERTLLEQLLEPDMEKEPVKYTAYKVAGLIGKDNIDDAVREFCIKYLSSNEEGNDFTVKMFNMLISAADKDKGVIGRIREFSKGIKQEIREVITDPEALWYFQNIIGQAVVILSAVEDGIKGAGEMRVTNDSGNMLQAGDKDRGQSFIDESSIPTGLGSAGAEGMPGAYDRGYETFKKLGDNILEDLVYGRDRFEEALASKESFIMYRMVHGLLPVAEGIEKYTKNGLISTFHKTVFLRDFVSGSYQTTSTGPGHFQGLQLDVKQVTAGLGIQFNVKYNSKGEMIKVLAQYIKEGDFFYALPGCVDYMVNLGDLEFNDFSVKLSKEAATKFNPDIDFKTEGVLESVSKKVSKKAPYVVGMIGKELLILNNMEEQPKLKWIDEPDASVLTTGRSFDLTSLYKAINSESNWRRFTGSDSKTEGIAYNAYKRSEGKVGARFPIMSQDVVRGIMERTEELPAAPSSLYFGKMGTMTYLEENSGFLSQLQKKVNTSPKLIRLPLEILAKMDKEDAAKLIEGIQQTAYGHIELYSSQEMITPDESVYLKYGVHKKDLPEGFLENRSNTITLIPVFQNNSIEAQDISIDKIGGIRAEDTIILPTGICHDMAGVARSVILGLRLAELSGGQIDGEFLDETLAQYKAFCEFYGIKEFGVNKHDLAALVIGNINDVVKAMNKLIKYMPIMPLNTEEIREIYEGVHEVLTRA